MTDKEMVKAIGSKTGSAMFREVESLVVMWAKRNPRAAKQNMIDNQMRREEMTDKKYGVMDNEAMAGGRLLLSIHPELVNFIEFFYPQFFASKENVREFARIYKMFRIPEDV